MTFPVSSTCSNHCELPGHWPFGMVATTALLAGRPTMNSVVMTLRLVVLAMHAVPFKRGAVINIQVLKTQYGLG